MLNSCLVIGILAEKKVFNLQTAEDLVLFCFAWNGATYEVWTWIWIPCISEVFRSDFRFRQKPKYTFWLLTQFFLSFLHITFTKKSLDEDFSCPHVPLCWTRSVSCQQVSQVLSPGPSTGLACYQFSCVYQMSDLHKRRRGRFALAFMATAFILLSVRWFILQPFWHWEARSWHLCPLELHFPRSPPLLRFQCENSTHPLLSPFVSQLPHVHGCQPCCTPCMMCTTEFTCPRAFLVEHKRQEICFLSTCIKLWWKLWVCGLRPQFEVVLIAVLNLSTKMQTATWQNCG